MSTALDAVLGRLEGPKRSCKQWKARCPAHDDKNASWSIKEDDGKILLHCFAGCTIEAVLATLKMEAKEMFSETTHQKQKPHIVATYDCTDELGTLLYQNVRFEPKGFRQRRPNGKGGWTWNLDAVPRVLYNLPLVLAASELLVVEGEKDGDTGNILGFTTTTSGAAGSWKDEFSEALRHKAHGHYSEGERAGIAAEEPAQKAALTQGGGNRQQQDDGQQRAVGTIHRCRRRVPRRSLHHELHDFGSEHSAVATENEFIVILSSMPKPRHDVLLAAAILICLNPGVVGSPPNVTYMPFSEAEPILAAMAETLPAELQNAPPDRLASLWPTWAKSRDAAIRKRLLQGDEDSVVNFLLFGTSFTRQPRVTNEQLRDLAGNKGDTPRIEGAAGLGQLIEARIQDLVSGMTTRGSNERLLFVRKVMERAGIRFARTSDRREGGKGRLEADGPATQAAQFLHESYLRVLEEQDSFQQVLAAARSLSDPTEEFAERSKLYKERGLSLDTSLPPNFALEVALKTIGQSGLLAAGSVRRVGIIGPGLDFTDKQEGYDFYRTQTVQPFAVMDSLLRLGLARGNDLGVDTLDLSPRVNDHVERARHAATQGHGYKLQLPRDPSRGWMPALVDYWRRFGDQIGSPASAVAVPPGLRGVVSRAVRVRPEFVRSLRAVDLDIILQREEPGPDQAKFDLLIATNILVYYDTFEQSLALANIQSMLRPGGVLLTNTLLLELPSSKMKGLDYVSVAYSDRETDGDRILWYVRRP